MEREERINKLTKNITIIIRKMKYNVQLELAKVKFLMIS